jgi:hypothetical protein
MHALPIFAAKSEQSFLRFDPDHVMLGISAAVNGSWM